jgi:asparagine synthase (glutamine-hydrolysing)
VFNKSALASRLRSRGLPVREGDATDLLLSVYAAEGTDGLRHVDGQFVVAIWDGVEHELRLIRDFLGVIPVYYWTGRDGVAFASQIKGLLQHPAVDRSYDLGSVANFLTLLAVPGPATLFAGVNKLPPGHMATFGADGAVALRRYWDLVQDAIPERTDAAFYIERVRELHRAAIDGRISEQPVGALLSGGNDSSANVALLAKRVTSPLRTFTVGLAEVEGDPEYTDLAYARKVAQHVGSVHTEHLMTTDEFLQAIPLVSAELDDLVSEPSSIFLRRALQLARDSGVQTVITGEANDELCCGHGEMIEIRDGYYERWIPYMRKPAMIRRLAALVAPYLFPRRADILARAANDQEYFWNFEIGWPQSAQAQILTPAALGRIGSATAAEAVARCRARFNESEHAGRDYLNYIVYSMMQDFYFGNLMLGKLDLLARGLGLDARCPYTEPNYAHLVYNIPASFKTRDGTVKWFFKKAIEGLLPDEIIYRPKQGFRTPVVELFKGRLGDWAQPYLLDGGFTAEGIVKRRHVEWLLKQHRAGAADYSNKLWTLMALNLWYERWLTGTRSTLSAA